MDCQTINLKTIDSTNEYGKEHFTKFDPNSLTLITAEEQTKGKGRFGRKWYSPKGKNIYATFCFTLPKETKHLTALSHLMALSLCNILIEYNLKPKIKWPNDIYLAQKKVAGILCEIIFTNEIIQIILGIGVNVNMDNKELNFIDQQATSLKQISKKTFDVQNVIEDLKKSFITHLTLFKNEGFFPFHNEFDTLLLYKGKEVLIETTGNTHRGILHSTNVDGALNLYQDNRTMISITSGSLRPINL